MKSTKSSGLARVVEERLELDSARLQALIQRVRRGRQRVDLLLARGHARLLQDERPLDFCELLLVEELDARRLPLEDGELRPVPRRLVLELEDVRFRPLRELDEPSPAVDLVHGVFCVWASRRGLPGVPCDRVDRPWAGKVDELIFRGRMLPQLVQDLRGERGEEPEKLGTGPIDHQLGSVQIQERRLHLCRRRDLVEETDPGSELPGSRVLSASGEGVREVVFRDDAGPQLTFELKDALAQGREPHSGVPACVVMALGPFEPPLEVVTRLASGLPVGGDLEYADELTLGRAIEARRAL